MRPKRCYDGFGQWRSQRHTNSKMHLVFSALLAQLGTNLAGLRLQYPCSMCAVAL